MDKLDKFIKETEKPHDYTRYILGYLVPWIHELRQRGLLTKGNYTWKPNRKAAEVWIYEGELYKGVAFGYGEMVWIEDENERKSPTVILNGMFKDGKAHGIVTVTSQHVRHGRYCTIGNWGIWGGDRIEGEFYEGNR